MIKDFSFWAFLPPLFSLFTAAGVWLVYFVAVDHMTVVPLSSETWDFSRSLYPPYISMAGNFPPASCIFSQVMNLSAFGGLLIGVCRYLQVRRHMTSVWLNCCSLVVFSIACGGMSLLGNFQLFPQTVIHNLGAGLTFGLGTVYCWMQSFITLTVEQRLSRVAAAVRFLLSTCILVTVISYFWLMADHTHMLAARCQWALVSFLLLFISTFALEFRDSNFYFVSVDTVAHPVTQSNLEDESDDLPNHM
ncbi:unnamed protein product [Ophioblennius macclurei]